MWAQKSEVEINKRKQESKKERKHALDQEMRFKKNRRKEMEHANYKGLIENL